MTKGSGDFFGGDYFSSTGQVPFRGLVVTATPIGNLGDLTPRAASVLREADIVACEDSRHTGRLLSRLGVKKRLISYHDYSREGVFEELISALRGGGVVALVSDAGTPLISDPGYELVSACRKEGIPVSVLPGASAFLAGLAASGLPMDEFHFAGFLPVSVKKKRDRLEALMAIGTTMVFYESPKRLIATLEIMLTLYPDRDIVVARELTKLHESFYHGTVASLYEDLRGSELKGEIVVMLGPFELERVYSDDEVIEALKDAVSEGLSHKDATSHVAALSGRTKKEVYGLALGLKNAARGGKVR